MNIITVCGPFLWGKHLILLLEITENSCYYPLPTESGWLPENRKKFCYYPSPTESCRLLEMTEKTKKFNKLNLAALGVGHSSGVDLRQYFW